MVDPKTRHRAVMVALSMAEDEELSAEDRLQALSFLIPQQHEFPPLYPEKEEANTDAR